ncbi:MAG: hypothetical protein II863_19195 [Kiritimatiellae bacterium]|nr:hypothetical protein [Kiritimatiellia bacterium]
MTLALSSTLRISSTSPTRFTSAPDQSHQSASLPYAPNVGSFAESRFQ